MATEKRQGLSPLKLTLIGILALMLVLGGVLILQARFIKASAEAYMFGYPLVLFDVSSRTSMGSVAPENTVYRKRSFPDSDFRGVVRPNVDTLYTSSFLDLNDGPFVLEAPANTQRYALAPVLDAWGNVFLTVGTRTDGGRGGRFLLARSDWRGEVPDGLTLVRSPTRAAWLLARIQTNGEGDYGLVHGLQDQYHVRTLAAWRAAPDRPGEGEKPAPPAPVDQPGATLPPAPVDEVADMSTPAFYERLTALMIDNPPAARDAPMMRRLADMGIAPGKAPEWNWLERQSARLGRKLADIGLDRARNDTKGAINGWLYPPMILGEYGVNYPVRAAVSKFGFGANKAADAIYPNAVLDGEGRRLDGDHTYRLHFKAEALPPVRGFWSITAYGADHFLIPNSAHHYAIRDRDPLSYNPDGSLDLYFGPERPVDVPASNWIPVARGEAFQLTARLYWPQAQALDGRWRLPPLQKQT